MKKYFVLLLALHSAPSFSWTLADKVLYDSYQSCLNHKLKDVDISKTNIAMAKKVFIEDCKKAFCVDEREVTQEEYDLCNSSSERGAPDAIKWQKLYPNESTNIGIEDYCKKKRLKDITCY